MGGRCCYASEWVFDGAYWAGEAEMGTEEADALIDEEDDGDVDAEAAAAVLALAAATKPALISASLLQSMTKRARLQFIRHSVTARVALR